MANWSDEPSARAGAKVCLACGRPIEETLWWVGLLGSLESRDIHRPLDPLLAKPPEKAALRSWPDGASRAAPCAGFGRRRLIRADRSISQYASRNGDRRHCVVRGRSNSGSCVRHSSIATGQRGWKRQPRGIRDRVGRLAGAGSAGASGRAGRAAGTTEAAPSCTGAAGSRTTCLGGPLLDDPARGTSPRSGRRSAPPWTGRA